MVEEQLDEMNFGSVENLENLSFDAIYKLCILRTINKMSDLFTFSLCVQTLENLLYDDLFSEREINGKKLVYFEDIKIQEENLVQTYGSRESKNFQMDFMQFKFRLLMSFLKSRIPRNIEAEI